jgi:hypothetical protein
MYDEGFADDYFEGVYNVACYKCHGERVMPVKSGRPIYIEHNEEDRYE